MIDHAKIDDPTPMVTYALFTLDKEFVRFCTIGEYMRSLTPSRTIAVDGVEMKVLFSGVDRIRAEMTRQGRPKMRPSCLS